MGVPPTVLVRKLGWPAEFDYSRNLPSVLVWNLCKLVSTPASYLAYL
jgi:hypothetical protein